MESTTPPFAPGPDRTQELLRESVRNERDQAKKWLLLKPTIERLLSRDGRNRKTHLEVVKILKEQYGFNALYVSQAHFHQQFNPTRIATFRLTCLSSSGVDKLKYQLQRWNIGANLPARVKRTICKAVQRRRAKLDRSTVVRYKGEPIDPQKLHRWLRQEEANSSITLQPTASGSANNRRPISGQDLQLGGKM